MIYTPKKTHTCTKTLVELSQPTKSNILNSQRIIRVVRMEAKESAHEGRKRAGKEVNEGGTMHTCLRQKNNIKIMLVKSIKEQKKKRICRRRS